MMEDISRRDAIKLLGMGALSLMGLSIAGCSGGSTGSSSKGGTSKTSSNGSATVFTPASFLTMESGIWYTLDTGEAWASDATDPGKDDMPRYVCNFHDGTVDVYSCTMTLGDIAQTTDDQVLAAAQSAAASGETASGTDVARYKGAEGGTVQIHVYTDGTGNVVSYEEFIVDDFQTELSTSTVAKEDETMSFPVTGIQVYDSIFGGFGNTDNGMYRFIMRIPNGDTTKVSFAMDTDLSTPGIILDK